MLVDNELLRLAGLRFMPSDMSGHREVLADVPPDVLHAAVGLALRECRDFPTPSELLEFVSRARVARLSSAVDVIDERPIDPVEVAIPHTGKVLRITRDYAHQCDLCDDSGWRPFWCGPREAMPGVLQLRSVQTLDCGRRLDHAPHEFAEACLCREWNRAYQRGRDVLAAGARKRAEGKA